MLLWRGEGQVHRHREEKGLCLCRFGLAEEANVKGECHEHR